MGKIHNPEYLQPNQVHTIKTPSEKFFAAMFFMSDLYKKFGYNIIHEPEIFYTKLKGKHRSTLPDFKVVPPEVRPEIFVEVTESPNLRSKADQRKVMREVIDPVHAYIQFPWRLLMYPELCFQLISQLAHGALSTPEAMHQVSQKLQDPTFWPKNDYDTDRWLPK